MRIHNTLLEMCKQIDNQENNNAIYVTQVIMSILKKDTNLTLKDIEVVLRELDSRVFLLALPALAFPTYDALNPLMVLEVPCMTILWVCMNGYKEAYSTWKEYYKNYKLHPPEAWTNYNQAILVNCGFLTLKKNDPTINN